MFETCGSSRFALARRRTVGVWGAFVDEGAVSPARRAYLQSIPSDGRSFMHPAPPALAGPPPGQPTCRLSHCPRSLHDCIGTGAEAPPPPPPELLAPAAGTVQVQRPCSSLEPTLACTPMPPPAHLHPAPLLPTRLRLLAARPRAHLPADHFFTVHPPTRPRLAHHRVCVFGTFWGLFAKPVGTGLLMTCSAVGGCERL